MINYDHNCFYRKGDCIDIILFLSWTIEGSALTYSISVFTPAMMFSAMNGSDINNIRKFRDRLRALHLSNTPNTAAAYNLFVDQYDVFN